MPPYAVVAGNPARIVRYRHSEADIATLLAARWWALPDAEIKRLLPVLLSGDVAALPLEGQSAPGFPATTQR